MYKKLNDVIFIQLENKRQRFGSSSSNVVRTNFVIFLPSVKVDCKYTWIYSVKVNVDIAPSLQVWVEFAANYANFECFHLLSFTLWTLYRVSNVHTPSLPLPVTPFVPLFTIHWFFLLLCGAWYQIWLAQKKFGILSRAAHAHTNKHTHTYMYIWITHTHTNNIWIAYMCY